VVRTLYLSVLLTGSVFAADYEEYAYGSENYLACEKLAKQTRKGNIVKVEFRIEVDQPIYEFDIRAPDSRDYDVECHAGKKQIIEIEREVPSVSHPLFHEKKKIDEQQAKKIALERWPGNILEIEYEIEPDGAASYEFDIHNVNGKEIKVEIDASSGDIVEQSVELWQEGYE